MAPWIMNLAPWIIARPLFAANHCKMAERRTAVMEGAKAMIISSKLRLAWRALDQRSRSRPDFETSRLLNRYCSFRAMMDRRATFEITLLGALSLAFATFVFRWVLNWYLGLFGLSAGASATGFVNFAIAGLGTAFIVGLFCALPLVEDLILRGHETALCLVTRVVLCTVALGAGFLLDQLGVLQGLFVIAMLVGVLCAVRRYSSEGSERVGRGFLSVLATWMTTIWLLLFAVAGHAVFREPQPQPSHYEPVVWGVFLLFGAVVHLLARSGRRAGFALAIVLLGTGALWTGQFQPALARIVRASLYLTNDGGGRLMAVTADGRQICDLGAYDVHFPVLAGPEGCVTAFSRDLVSELAKGSANAQARKLSDLQAGYAAANRESPVTAAMRGVRDTQNAIGN